jgi:hypothetical protein
MAYRGTFAVKLNADDLRVFNQELFDRVQQQLGETLSGGLTSINLYKLDKGTQEELLAAAPLVAKMSDLAVRNKLYNQAVMMPHDKVKSSQTRTRQAQDLSSISASKAWFLRS